ncbi:UDP-N-acetylmuramate dehydrogenase [Agitococcus lubricus]|uniref:UDP-N-acetylenolpyruvoylglucosamine reductase n=1 Tax=Agitococcus lubricus TaxID=1077255 RepID=A0A2T5J1Q8_9GAMM|nr:UDP-N-acetylmuramate dehydrogenase [Agitococcus lubricus]PTQ90381.1 UDP-N-acetylmuramate dehydrogenase [Agitococcus lubricus]
MFLENVSLQKYHSFALATQARFLWTVNRVEQLQQALRTITAKNLPVFILGGGSNVIFTQNYAGLILCPQLKGIRYQYVNHTQVLVEAAAGENWHDFVQYCLAKGWYGLENLSLIPGTVGAAPIQNIGAYGVEIKDCFASLTAIHRQTGRSQEFSLHDCQFAYRDSVFKQHLKDQFVITHVRFLLSTQSLVKTQYGDIAARLSSWHITQATPQDVARAIIAIRQQKLPDPAHIGNAGSFFKNPVVTEAHFNQLKAQYPHIVAYPQAHGVKLAAGWLIEQAGWKGQNLGQAGVYEKQALVLVNRGAATGQEVMALARQIQDSVWAKFMVALEIEVNLL